jgi:hypothetical protein
MSESDLKTEAEIEDFGDELSDEALDREQGGGRFCPRCQSCGGASFVG